MVFNLKKTTASHIFLARLSSSDQAQSAYNTFFGGVSAIFTSRFFSFWSRIVGKKLNYVICFLNVGKKQGFPFSLGHD